MAPIKFEENIKETLDKRTIKPASELWDKLSNRLETHDKKKSNKLIWFTGIAASVVGLLFLLNSLFFNSFVPDETLPQIVDVESVKTEVKVNKKDIKSIDDPSLKENLKVKKIIVNSTSNTKLVSQSNSQSKNSASKINSMTNEVVAENNNISQKGKNQKIEFKAYLENIDSQEDNKIGTIASNVEIATLDSKSLDIEIEALLNDAQQKVTSSDSTKKIDANSLLQDVEADLDQSFRDKVFEALKTNYKKVKTAVADRNN
jgi:hypothetical protein